MNGASPGSGLQGQHAVVTGGGRGIGVAIAAALASEGAQVTVMGRTSAVLHETASMLSDRYGTRVAAVTCDVMVEADVVRAFAAAVQQFGPVQILVNNAGQAEAGHFTEIPLATWNRIIAVNMTGTFLCTQQVLPAMLAASSGRILNIASTAGLKGYAMTAAYTAAKHGVVGLTRALAAETARTGITVNAICPGYTEGTDMFQAAVDNVTRAKGISTQEAARVLAKYSPRGTLITPQEVADAVLWLSSAGASAITGQAIAVAAGEVM
jgi:NAD(P)-dependent dehydrogenase (short-subunit alcohol dehydrogenase family)